MNVHAIRLIRSRATHPHTPTHTQARQASFSHLIQHASQYATSSRPHGAPVHARAGVQGAQERILRESPFVKTVMNACPSACSLRVCASILLFERWTCITQSHTIWMSTKPYHEQLARAVWVRPTWHDGGEPSVWGCRKSMIDPIAASVSSLLSRYRERLRRVLTQRSHRRRRAARSTAAPALLTRPRMRLMLDAQGSQSHTFAYAWQNASLAAKDPAPVIARWAPVR